MKGGKLTRAESTCLISVFSRSDYQDFLTLWRDADTDIPILNQAEAEYAKLQ